MSDTKAAIDGLLARIAAESRFAANAKIEDPSAAMQTMLPIIWEVVAESAGIVKALAARVSALEAGKAAGSDEAELAAYRACVELTGENETLNATIREQAAEIERSRQHAANMRIEADSSINGWNKALDGWSKSEDKSQALTAERDALAAFKAYVHKRLDDAGVPVDPESPHRAEGCRIGGRLDWIFSERDRYESQLADIARLQAENERLTSVCKEFDTLVSRLSRSPWRDVATDPPTKADGDEHGWVFAGWRDGYTSRKAVIRVVEDGATHWMPIPPRPEKTVLAVAPQVEQKVAVAPVPPLVFGPETPKIPVFDARTAKAESRWEISDGSVWTFLRRCNNGEALFLNFYGVERYTNVSGDGRSDGIHVIGPAADQPSPPDTVGPTADSVISDSAPGVGQSDAPVGEDVLPLADRIADALMMVESPEDRCAAFHLEHPQDGEASPDMRVRFGWLAVRAKIASVLEDKGATTESEVQP